MFDGILSNRMQSPKCHRQMFTIEGNNCFNDGLSCMKIENHTTHATLMAVVDRSMKQEIRAPCVTIACIASPTACSIAYGIFETASNLIKCCQT